jgi:hypothetical protein
MGSIKRAGNGVVEFVSGDVTSREMQFNDGTLRQQMPQFSSSIHSLAVIFVCRLPCFAKSLLLFRRLVFFSSSLVHQKLSPLFPRGDVGVTKTQKIKKRKFPFGDERRQLRVIRALPFVLGNLCQVKKTIGGGGGTWFLFAYFESGV